MTFCQTYGAKGYILIAPNPIAETVGPFLPSLRVGIFFNDILQLDLCFYDAAEDEFAVLCGLTLSPLYTLGQAFTGPPGLDPHLILDP